MNELLKESLGIESIDFQSDDFFQQVVDWVTEARGHYKDSWWPKFFQRINDDLCIKLQNTIKKRTNMSVSFYIVDNRYAKAMAYTHIEAINPNAGLYTSRLDSGSIEYIARDFKKRYENIISKSPGWVDRKKAKVYGVFEKINFQIVLSTGFLKNDNLSSEEVAAAIVHEIGHCWDTLATVSVGHQFIHGMSELHRALTGIASPEDKKYILEYMNTKEQLSMSDEEISKLCFASPETAVGLILTNRVMRIKSQTGIGAQEARASEQGADLFAARFGAAVHIASLVDKFGKAFWDVQQQHKLVHLLVQSIQLIGFYISPVKFIISLLIMLLSVDIHFPYDSLINRTDKMRQQLILRLKDRSLSKDVIASIAEEIKTIEQMQKNYSNNVSVMEMLTRIISSKKRTVIQTQDLIYHLERMGNNKLFAAAAKIQTVS